MPDRFMTTPIVHHGAGALGQLDGEIRRLGGGCVGLITDSGVARAGLIEPVRQAISCELHICTQAAPEPRYEIVEGCVAFLREHRCDLVIGLGGGSAIDTAKMAAVLLKNEGSVADYWGADRIPRPGAPLIAIPTTAGTGSEASPAAVFIDPADGTKKGVRADHLMAKAAILDPVLTLGLPQSLTASTGMDALTHAIECYTSLRATLMSDLCLERAIQLIGENLLVAYANGANLAAREAMLMASYLAGIGLAVSGVGIVHALAHTVGGMYGLRHGEANALLLPYAMAFNRIGCQAKYARVAALLGEPIAGLSLDEASGRAVAAVRRLVDALGLPQRLRETGVPEAALDRVAVRCLETQGRLVANNPRATTVADARAILQAAY